MQRAWLKHGMIGIVALAAVQCGSTSAGDENLAACSSCQEEALSEAAAALKESSAAIRTMWAAYCNAMNADLSLDTSHTDDAGACGVLGARINSAMAAGVSISMSVSGATCQGQDTVLEAQCQGACAGQLACDQASCEAGKSATACQTDGGCLSYCTGMLACDPTGVLVPACHALGSAKMTCTATPVVNVVGDAELAQAEQKHAAELAAVWSLSEEFDKLIDAIPCSSQESQCVSDACSTIDKARVSKKAVVMLGY
ncbi:MAG: hypothetical protein HY898_09290 [Deltaproteobacteria bacterium]|nr:hypothetical protein [Deltaproteobacteria bacterium]